MANSGDFMIVAPYDWLLKNVEINVPKTLASKMILFRGERVFRVGLKIETNKQTLIFMSINLKKMGLTVKGVVYWYTTEVSAAQSKLAPKIPQHQMQMLHNGDCSFQLFTSDLSARASGNGTFAFRIYIDGISHQYRYQLSDRLLKQQLWAAAKNQQHGTDVELLVKGTKFYAHKAILAARSSVFAAEFFKKEHSGDVPYQLKIDNVDPSTVEQFLYFLYTGESMTQNFANIELLKLAEIYKLTTLTDLCRNSLKEVTAQQMANIGAAIIQPTAATGCPFEIKQEKDTEIFFDQNISIISLQGSPRVDTAWPTPIVLFRYKNEDMFFLELKRETSDTITYPASVQVRFMSAKHLDFGFKVVEVTNNQKEFAENWDIMNQRNSQENDGLSLFTRNIQFSRYYSEICFRLKVVSAVENNCFEMVDTNWAAQLWLASTKRQLTDVDVIVGEKKLEAHRVILCARSPVFCTLLNKISNTGKPTITIGAEFELANVEKFLKFLYTGSLDILANKQLLALAELYEVETLKKICRANNQNPDVEDLTNSLLAL